MLDRGTRTVHASFSAVLTAVALAAACRPGGKTEAPLEHGDTQAAIAAYDDPSRDAWALPERVVSALELRTDMVVADIGAGSGYFTRRIAAALTSGKVLAVDVDSEFKAHIEASIAEWGTPNVEPRLALYEHPLLPQQSIDLAFVSNSYGFLRDRSVYFAAVRAALRPGGNVVVIDFRADADCHAIPVCPVAAQRISRDRVIDELRAAGLTLKREETFLPAQYLLVFAPST